MAVFEPQSESARRVVKRYAPGPALELVTDTDDHHFLRARAGEAERTDRCLCLLIYANRLASSVRGERSLRAACFLVSAECVEISALGQRVVRTDADLIVMSTRVAASFLVRVAQADQESRRKLVVCERAADVVRLCRREC